MTLVPLVTPPRLDPRLLPDELLGMVFGVVVPVRLIPVPVLVLDPVAEVPSPGKFEAPTVPTPGVVTVVGVTVMGLAVDGVIVVVGLTAVGVIAVAVVGLTVVGVAEPLAPPVPD